jgi:hypothetical protein
MNRTRLVALADAGIIAQLGFRKRIAAFGGLSSDDSGVGLRVLRKGLDIEIGFHSVEQTVLWQDDLR